MDPDILLIIGLVGMLLSVPSFLSAFSESRAPRLAAVLVVLGGAMVVGAVLWAPGGYAPSEIPVVFISVLGRIVN